MMGNSTQQRSQLGKQKSSENHSIAKHYLKKAYDVFKDGDNVSDYSNHSTIRNCLEVDYQGRLPTQLNKKKARPLTC